MRRTPLTQIVIDTKDDYDIHRWAAEFGVHPLALRAALTVVGPRVTDLRLHYNISDVVNFPNRHTPEKKMA